jgi:predicted nucleotidyltransferase component of viral defense system
MIPRPDIAKWQEHSPWLEFSQIEQDLVICRTLIALFADPFLNENLAFRGGTALHKLYLQPAPRYSEDIDLVQVIPGPIKPILKRIGEIIYFFEEPRTTDIRGHGAKAIYRFTSEYEGIRLRLKIEINCKEHINLLDWVQKPLEVKSAWFDGQATIRTYNINELLGTKLWALYQRKKGRDLFDLDYSRRNTDLDLDKIIYCFNQYILTSNLQPPGQKEFMKNILKKEEDPGFAGDMEGILRSGIEYDQAEAFAWLRSELISRI